MKKKYIIFCFISLVLLLFLNFNVLALVRKMALPELITRAGIIVKATVEKTEAMWMDDERGKHIYTIATLRRNAVLKGTIVRETFTLEVVGGTVGEVTEHVTDSYSLEKGEQVILFLERAPLRILGGWQGKYVVYDGKVYLENREVPVEWFMQMIREMVSDPERVISLDKVTSEGALPHGGDRGVSEIPTMPGEKPKETLIEDGNNAPLAGELGVSEIPTMPGEKKVK